MDIVLGVSMTPTTVRMVLVEGEKADGVTVDHDVFEVNSADGSATSNAADQVAAAVLGTQESAEASGHHLKSIGVTWTHHSDAAALRDTLAARGIEDVMLVSATHAAASLAQAVGRAIGYDTTALLFIEKDIATLSVVQTEDGSVVKVLTRDLHDSDAMAVFTEMATVRRVRGVATAGPVHRRLRCRRRSRQGSRGEPGGPARQRSRRTRTRARPRRGARIRACARDGGVHRRPRLFAGPRRTPPPAAPTRSWQARPPRWRAWPRRWRASPPRWHPQAPPRRIRTRWRTPTRSRYPSPKRSTRTRAASRSCSSAARLTSIFVVGVVALVISLAVSIRPTVDQRPSPGQTPVIPSQAAPAPVQKLAPAAPPPAPAPAAPPPEIIKAPVPVVQQAPAQAPRTVFVRNPRPHLRRPPARCLWHRRRYPYLPHRCRCPRPRWSRRCSSPPVYNPQPPVYYPQRPPVWVPPWQRPLVAAAVAATAAAIPDDPPQQSPQYPGSGGYPRLRPVRVDTRARVATPVRAQVGFGVR